jgi:hypothetical protein
MDLNKLIKEHYTAPTNAGELKKLIKLNNVNYEFNKNLKIAKSSILLPKNHKLITAASYSCTVTTSTATSTSSIGNASSSNVASSRGNASNASNASNANNKQLQYNTFVEANIPHIKEILMTVDNIVLCGSGALYPYSSQNEPILPNSFNLFLYSADTVSIREMIKSQNIKIIKILEILNKYGYKYNICIVKGCFKITTSQNIVIKIILKNYKSISEILHSFDLPSRAIAYDGITTYLTKLSAWSLVTKLNIIMPTYIEDIYETALIKYFNRGYGIVFPYLKFENNSLEIANLHLKWEYINDDIAIGTIQLASLNMLSAVFTNDINLNTISSGYAINIDRKTNIIENNYYQILCKNDYFQHMIYSAELLTPTRITDFKIHNLLHLNDYVKWLYGYIHTNLIIKRYNKYFINEEFLKMVFGNEYESLSLIATQIKELNKRISFLNAAKMEGKIFILKELIDIIIDTESKKIESINNLKIDWNIYINRYIQSNLTYEEWYGVSNFRYLAKYASHDLNSIQKNINTYIDDLNANAPICALCLHNIHHLSPNTITLKCGHLFHESPSSGSDECRGIDIWLQKNNSCPECRNIDPKEKLQKNQLIF